MEMNICWLVIIHLISSSIEFGSAWDEDPNRLPSKCESKT